VGQDTYYKSGFNIFPVSKKI